MNPRAARHLAGQRADLHAGRFGRGGEHHSAGQQAAPSNPNLLSRRIVQEIGIAVVDLWIDAPDFRIEARG